jgi:hypothetical protein
MSTEVLDTAGIVPSPDLLQEPIETEQENAPAPTEEPAEAKKRLSVFEDFLQNLDFSDSDSQQDGTSPSDDPDAPKKNE